MKKVGGREATTGVIPGRYCLSVGKPDLPAPEGWEWKPLSKLARLESGHTPSRRRPDYWGGNVPWIGIKDATGNHGSAIFDTIQHTNELGIANSAARILPRNTVCLSRTASVGYVIVMGKPMATSQDFANWVCGDDLDHRFLKYALLLENDALHRFSYGSTHRTIYYPELKAFHLCAPDRAGQEAIADTLQFLDDKIELNRNTAATLEEMARALYRSWFVDFDPVRAKAEGRAPAHMDAATAGLFPDRFGEDGLPEGWQMEQFPEAIEIISGGTPQTSEPKYWGGDIPWYSVVDAPSSGQVFAMFTEKSISALGLKSCSAKLVPKGTTIVSARGTVGKLAMAGSDMVFNQSCYGLRHKSITADAFVYFATHRGVEQLQAMAHGSVFATITKKTFDGLAVVGSCQLVMIAFESAAMQFLSRIHQLNEENQTLATLRDTLMPRLMSGELRVSTAKEIIEEVA